MWAAGSFSAWLVTFLEMQPGGGECTKLFSQCSNEYPQGC